MNRPADFENGQACCFCLEGKADAAEA